MTWEWVLVPFLPLMLVFLVPACLFMALSSLIPLKGRFWSEYADSDASFFSFLFGNFAFAISLLSRFLAGTIVAAYVLLGIGVVLYLLGLLFGIGTNFITRADFVVKRKGGS